MITVNMFSVNGHDSMVLEFEEAKKKAKKFVSETKGRIVDLNKNEMIKTDDMTDVSEVLFLSPLVGG